MSSTVGSTRHILDPDELAALEDQRDFLLASLRDLEREHDAGDLDDHDFQTLRDDYTARAAEVLRAIEGRRAALDAAHAPLSWRKRLLALAGVAAFALVAGFVVAGAIGARGEGDTLSGGVTTKSTPSQRAQRCVPEIQSDPVGALACFKEVLDDDPRNPVALTFTGWTLELNAGRLPTDEAERLQATALGYIERAIEADPNYSNARAFRAVMAFRRGEYQQAKTYLEEFRANDPSADAQAVIKQMDLDGQIEAALSAGDTSTTSSTLPFSPTTTPG